MGRVRASIDIAQRISEAEALWFDTARWPTFVDGFHHVERQDDGWPQDAGARLVWTSTPGGRGRVAEEVVDFDARNHLASRVEDEQMIGTQTIRFEPRDGHVRVWLELDYALKNGSKVVDVLFVRRALREALARTLRRFARELRAERDSL